MRLALHIFKKDARRLWWEVAVTLGVLAMLTHLDSTRADAIPGPMEGLLNLLLPAVWIYLVAVLIHEEALVGNRQFWVTRPYPSMVLLGAKVLFLLAFIHIPSLVADFIIVTARGFQPLNFLPSLLWKQALLAGAVTLPAAALAAVTRSLTQFVPFAVLLAAAAGALAGNLYLVQPWIRVDEVRWAIVLIVIATGALTILVLQYTARRTPASRALGLAAAAAAGLLLAYLPRDYTVSIACAFSGRHSHDPTVSIAAAARGPLPEAWVPQWPGSSGQFALPIDVSGLPENLNRVMLDQVRFEIFIPRQERWAMSALPSTVSAPTDPVGAGILLIDQKSWWHMIRAERAVYDRIIDTPVTLTGKIVAHLLHESESVFIPISPEARDVSRIGRCSSMFADDRRGREMLKILCESPSKLPLGARVKFIHPKTGDLLPRSLGDGGNFMSYPAWAWLSPLHRRQTFFHLAEESGRGSTSLVPDTASSDAKVELTRLELERCTIFNYELRNVVLRDFVTRHPRP